MTFKGYCISLDFLIKQANEDYLKDWYYSKSELFEENGLIEYDVIELYGCFIEFEDGHIMDFNNILEN